MLIVILIYDQLLFRPLVAWSERFRIDDQEERRPAAVLGAHHVPPLAADRTPLPHPSPR